MNFEKNSLSASPPEPGETQLPPSDSPALSYGVRASTEPPGAPVAFVPEDLRVPWGWTDLLVFILVAVVVFVLLLVVLGLGLSAFHVKVSAVQNSARLSGVISIVGDVLLFSSLLAYLALQIRLHFRQRFWRAIGWRPWDTGHLPRALAYFGFAVAGFLLALLVSVGSSFFNTKTKLPIESLYEDRLTAVLMLAIAVVMAPVVEETIFRGYLYPVVARSFGRGVGVVATGTLFGLMHAAQLWGGWGQIVLLVFVGVIFSYARAVKHTVFASYLLHVSYNFAISVGFLYGSHWLRVLPPGS